MTSLFKHRMLIRIITPLLTALFYFQASTLYAQSPSDFDETLTMDVWDPYAPDWTVAEFKKYIKRKYKKNINVVVKYVFSPNEFFDRVRANQTDIISPSHNLIQDDRFHFIKKRLVIPIDKRLIPNIKGVEPQFLNNEFITDGGILYGVPFAAGTYSLLYRKSAFKNPPESWSVLWDPQYRGRYAISKEFYESNIYITALALGFPKEKISEVDILKTQKFRKRLKSLLKYANYWKGIPHDEEVKTSVLTTAWGFSHSVHDDKKKEWGFAFPKEGLTLWTDYLLVTRAVNRSPFAKTLAMEWLNFILSPEFQSRVTIMQMRCYSAVPEAYNYGGSVTKVDPTEKKFLFKNALYWPVLTARNRNGLKYIYDSVEKELQTEAELKK